MSSKWSPSLKSSDKTLYAQLSTINGSESTNKKMHSLGAFIYFKLFENVGIRLSTHIQDVQCKRKTELQYILLLSQCDAEERL